MTTTAEPPASLPKTREIAFDDVKAALVAGWADFRRAPAFGLFFGAVFSLIGILISYMLIVRGTSYWVLPVAAGFPLIGPFAAVGLYEVSRRLERSEPLAWRDVLTVAFSRPGAQLPSYAFIVLFFFMVWVYLAHLVFALSVGTMTLPDLSSGAFFLTTGITVLIAGTLVGGALAALLFAISVISVPMFLDRTIDVVSAMVTSVRAVLQSPQAMIGWGIVIAVAIAVAMIPFFLGMIVVFPLLGHASWHLYRRTMEQGA